jgi:hypothetical protein
MPRRTIAIQIADPETVVVGFETGCPTRIFARECERRRGCNLSLRTTFYSQEVNARFKNLGAIWDQRNRAWLLPTTAALVRCRLLADAFPILAERALSVWDAWAANGFTAAYEAVLASAVAANAASMAAPAPAVSRERPGVPVLGAERVMPAMNDHLSLRSMPRAGCECDYCRTLRQRRRDAGIPNVPPQVDHSTSPAAWDGCLCRWCRSRRPAAIAPPPAPVVPRPAPPPAPVTPPVVNTSRCVCGACRGGVRFDGDDYVCDLCKAGAVARR